MANSSEYLAKAASYIGIGGTDNIFNTWYWGHNCYDPNTYPWCACFQSYISHELGGIFEPSAAASGIFNQLPHVADADVIPGDIVVFNWDGRNSTSWCDHVGVVEWFDHATGYFGTIEGNTGYADGGEVMRVNRYNYGNYFTSFARPNFDGGTTPKPPTYGGETTPPEKEPDSSHPDIFLQVELQDGTVLPATKYPDFAGWNGRKIAYIAAKCDWPLHISVKTRSGGNLESLENPWDISNHDTGCAGDGSDILAVQMCLFSPNEDKVVKYCVKTVNNDYYPWQRDYEVDSTQDGFAGDGRNAITEIKAVVADY